MHSLFYSSYSSSFSSLAQLLLLCGRRISRLYLSIFFIKDLRFHVGENVFNCDLAFQTPEMSGVDARMAAMTLVGMPWVLFFQVIVKEVVFSERSDSP